MVEVRLTGGSVAAAGFVLGRKLDSIPFSAYHLLIITWSALVGFIEGDRSGDHRLAVGAGQRAAASDGI